MNKFYFTENKEDIDNIVVIGEFALDVHNHPTKYTKVGVGKLVRMCSFDTDNQEQILNHSDIVKYQLFDLFYDGKNFYYFAPKVGKIRLTSEEENTLSDFIHTNSTWLEQTYPRKKAN